ncbi:hypothetical protein SAMN05443634_11032 [Chishuiella changwenlii]|uniref:Uncharacterized protein n=1 Tax=Chishuiella changwenlii TaxID=1434701 RepID=A0A1M7B4B8_9FLAO|nr:hypothetical protein GCM10010984_11550 [Chishuiella changwenlii]SHL49489.1 hypothetical protein SAMN05443634_11032 [Chishuiella changwenlii]
MKYNYNNIMIQKLRLRSLELFKSEKISWIEHNLNLIEMSKSLDKMLVDEHNYMFITNMINNYESDDIRELIKNIRLQSY